MARRGKVVLGPGQPLLELDGIENTGLPKDSAAKIAAAPMNILRLEMTVDGNEKKFSNEMTA